MEDVLVVEVAALFLRWLNERDRFLVFGSVSKRCRFLAFACPLPRVELAYIAPGRVIGNIFERLINRVHVKVPVPKFPRVTPSPLSRNLKARPLDARDSFAKHFVEHFDVEM